MKIHTDEHNQLHITMQGWERLLALQKEITLPRERITHLEFHKDFKAHDPIVWRVGGTGFPGVLYAGHFRGGGLPYFLYVQRPSGWPRFTARNVLEIVAMNDNDRQVTILLTSDSEQVQPLLKWYNAR